MSTDSIVAGLPSMQFGAPAPISWERFLDACAGDAGWVVDSIREGEWADLETQLRNAMAEARCGDARFRRPAVGCSLYWRDRVRACFQEADVMKRDEMLDRVWWDAAGEMTPPSAPLGRGALLTYAVRLRVALRRGSISDEKGGAVFGRMTAGTKQVGQSNNQTTKQSNNFPL